MNRNDLFLKRPASAFGEKWRDGTPLGNGLTGINLYGGISTETFIVSRYDMWSSVVERFNEAPNVSDCISKMRELGSKGDYIHASTVMYNRLRELGYTSAGQHMRCLRGVTFYFECPGVYSNYTRCLHMDTGEAEITFSLNKKPYKRRTFVSRNSDIVVSELLFGKPTSFQTKAAYFESHEDGRENHIKIVHLENENYDIRDGCYIYSSRNDDGLYCGLVIKITADSDTKFSSNEMIVEKANKALVFIKAFSNETERETAISNTIKAIKDELDDYNAAFSKHVALHRVLYESADISINQSRKYHSNEDLLLTARDKECSIELIEKLWRFGRYLFISGCHEKGAPFPLYGLWVSGYDRSWSQYVANENVEMCYWHTTVGNLNSLVKPLIQYYYNKMEIFRNCARNLYGCRGIYVSVYTTPGDSTPTHGVPVLLHFMGAGGWLARHFYDYYLATGDNELFEQEILPFMLSLSDFYEDYLYEGKKGQLEFYPSVSPENTPREYLNVDLGLGHPMPMYKNATIEFAILKELLENLVEIARTRPSLANRVNKWKELLAKIPDYLINDDGAIAEWIDQDVHDNYFHRHLSHVYPLFPGTEVEDQKRYDLLPHFEKAVDLRELGSYTGWSLAHMSSIYARMGRAEKALSMMNMMSKTCLLENFFTMHNDFRSMGITTDRMGDDRFAPIQFDAALGAVNAIQEWIIRVTKNRVYILPACPKKLNAGAARNLGIFGGKISFEWSLSQKSLDINILAERDIHFELILPFNKGSREIALKPGEKRSLHID